MSTGSSLPSLLCCRSSYPYGAMGHGTNPRPPPPIADQGCSSFSKQLKDRCNGSSPAIHETDMSEDNQLQ